MWRVRGPGLSENQGQGTQLDRSMGMRDVGCTCSPLGSTWGDSRGPQFGG